MKSAQFFAPLLLLGITAFTGLTQTVTPATPKGFEIRKNGTSAGTGSSVGLVSPSKKTKTQVITYTALSKEREWQNTDGKTMKARLLAFPSPTENKNSKNQTPQFTVISEQKVRFLMSHNKKAITYPIEKLSRADQEFIEKINQAAARAAKTPQEEKAKPSSKNK